MSLILDALNRADQERSEQNQTMNLHSPPSAKTSSNRPIKRWILEAAILVAAVVATYFISQSSSDNDKEHDIAKQPQIEAPAAPERQSSEPQPSQLQPKPTTQQNGTLPQKNTPVTAQSTELTPARTPKPEPNPAIDSLYQQQAQAAKKPKASKPSLPAQKAVAPSVSKPATPVNPAPPKTDFAQSMFERMPLVTQLPNRIKQKIPSIDYSVHVYSETETGGFVTLNGKRCRIGDEVAPGLVVIKILKDSVVLDFKGKQFRLLSLSSWANF